MQASEARFDFSQDYAHQAELHGLEGRPCSFGDGVHHGPQWALLTFDQPVTAPQVPVSASVRLLLLMSILRLTNNSRRVLIIIISGVMEML